jgi:hypothetical protein
MSQNIPLDVQPAWLSVIRRLQSVAKSDGLQVIKFTVLVDSEGIPQAWMEPEVHKVEPKGRASAILTMYAIDDKR